jgi:putative ABC transport system substrate-binding protein
LSARTSGKIYEQITLFWLMVTGVLITALPTDAQQAAKVPRIGYLLAAGSAETARRDAFRQGLRELGYVEGKNIIIEWRAAEGKLDRLDELAAELV